MKFDTLVNNILNERAVDVDTIPILDGTREIYTLAIYRDRDNQIKVTFIERLDPTAWSNVYNDDRNCTTWDWDVLGGREEDVSLQPYVGPSYIKAREALLALQMDNRLLTHDGHKWKNTKQELSMLQAAANALETISHLRGTWKVLYSVTTIGIYAGVEVDAQLYSGVHNAIEDDINSF